MSELADTDSGPIPSSPVKVTRSVHFLDFHKGSHRKYFFVKTLVRGKKEVWGKPLSTYYHQCAFVLLLSVGSCPLCQPKQRSKACSCVSNERMHKGPKAVGHGMLGSEL